MDNNPRVALLIETTRTYGRQLVRGIARYSRTYGPWFFYRPTLFYLGQPRRSNQFALLKKWRPTGIITQDSENLEQLNSLQVPIIVITGTKKTNPKYNITVTPNNFVIGKMGAEHLMEKGFRNFAYCGFKNMFWSQKRGDTFQQIITDAGFANYRYKGRSVFDWEKEKALLVDWLTFLPKPVGIMACNDDRAQEIAEVCEVVDFKLPYDIAVLGVDNDDQICEISNPAISSIALNTEPVGYKAAELLSKKMSGGKVPAQIIFVEPIRVVTRQSTDVIAVSNYMVSQAVQFIHNNSKKLIQVEDVLQNIGASRRNLDDKFIKYLGHSVHEEIKKTRIRTITKLLLETDMTVSQIAYNMGYSSADHIGRYFKQTTGITPAAYRKRHSFS